MTPILLLNVNYIMHCSFGCTQIAIPTSSVLVAIPRAQTARPGSVTVSRVCVPRAAVLVGQETTAIHVGI